MDSNIQIKNALENPETSATLLHAIVRRRYGEDWYLWDPVTVALELQDDYSAEVPAENMDKLSAMQVLITSGAFFQSKDAFIAVCGTFTEGDPLFETFDPLTVEELAWGVTEAAINRELLPFSAGIRRLVRELLAEEGYEEADYPTSLRELLEVSPDSEDVLGGLASKANKNNADLYIREQVEEMITQFSAIESMKGLDDQILEHGFMDAIVRGHR